MLERVTVATWAGVAPVQSLRAGAEGVSALSHAAFWPNVIAMNSRPFEVICEIEPPTRPDLLHVRHQIGVLAPVASPFLIPDNHIGRATVSSIAVAHEVAAMGGATSPA